MTTPTTVQVRLQIRADTAANWTSVNPILLTNELGLESDTKKFKIGNGTSAWVDLAYFPSIVSGGTVLGNLEIGTTGTLTFEGSTANGFETTLGVVDPTADRTILLPNQSGTVVVGGNASIVDADIAANAEIAVSKLADGAARQLLQTDAAGTGVEWTSNIDIPGTLDVTGVATFDNAVTIAGDLTVNGTTTNINTQNLVVEDKNIILADVATPTDVTADGGGITLKGATDKTINWIDSTDAWTSSERFSVPLGSAAAPSLTFTSDENTGIYSPGADQVAISTNGSGRLFVASDGKIGIGSSGSGTQSARTFIEGSGACPLEIDATAGSGGYLTLSNSGSAKAFFGFGSNIGTASVNDIAIRSQSGALAFQTGGANERLRITSAGLVGVGTSSPGALLDVNGAGNIVRLGDGTNTCDVRFKGPNNWAVQLNTSTDVFNIQRNSVPFLNVDGAGRLGVGTTSPGAPLEVIGTAGTISARATTGVSSQAIQIYNNGTDSYIDSTAYGAGSGGGIVFRRNGSGEMGRWDTSGRLLVGTSSSRNWSAVESQFQIESTSITSQSIVNNSASVTPALLALGKSRGTSVGSNTIVQSGDTLGNIVFLGADGNVLREAAYIRAEVDGTPGSADMPGRLVFSTTADGAAGPTQAMVIKNTQDVLLTTSTAATNSNGWYGMQVQSSSGGVSISRNGSNVLAFFHTSNVSGTSGTPVGTVSITTTATTYATSSDYRLKENVIAITDGITRLKQLKPSRFNFIADPSNTVDGFLAHEAAEVVPECATGEKDAVDDDGNPIYQGIDQSKLVPLLTAALQEAVAKIENLEARLTAAGI